MRACLAAARAYRDAMRASVRARLPVRTGGALVLHNIPARANKNNRLGILGVHVAERLRPGRGWERRAVAQLRCKGMGNWRAEFHYRRGGKVAAIAAARQARQRFEAQRDLLLRRTDA